MFVQHKTIHAFLVFLFSAIFIFCCSVFIFPKIFITDPTASFLSLDNKFLFYLLLGSTLFYAYKGMDSQKIMLSGLVAVLFVSLDVNRHGFSFQDIFADNILSLWIVFSLYFLYQFRERKNADSFAEPLSFGLIFPFWFILSLIYLKKTIIWFPQTHDFLLYAIDSTLGFHPNFLSSQIFVTFPFIVQKFFAIIYFALPFTFIIAYLRISKQHEKDRYQLALEFSGIGIVGMLCYLFMPSCGPVCAYGSAWPFHPPGVPLDPSTLMSPPVFLSDHLFPRNSLPSLHTAWILCIWRYLQKQGRVMRIIATLWGICALYATIVIGQHYLIDVITGFAFALIIIGFCAGNLRAFAVGTFLFTGWIWMIQHGLFFLRFSHFLPIILYIVTVFIVISLVNFNRESNLWQVIVNGRIFSIAKARKMLNAGSYSPN